MTHIPYKGTGQSVIDVLAGRVDALFAVITGVLPHVKDGKLRALAVSTAKRSPLAPMCRPSPNRATPDSMCLSPTR